MIAAPDRLTWEPQPEWTVRAELAGRAGIREPDRIAVTERNPHTGQPFTDHDDAIAAALEDMTIPALLCSLVLRDPPALLPIAAGVAVAELAGPKALLKWPNDVLLDGRKVAGILIEGRPQERWAVLGIGVNVAVDLDELPQELRASAGTLGLGEAELEPSLERLLMALETWLEQPAAAVLDAWRARDALLGAAVHWRDGSGMGAGIDAGGRLLVALADGREQALDAGEVHLVGVDGAPPVGP